MFRGNAEADIRRNLIRKGYIKGIIGLPPNLFYGTGIPACIIIIDKENAHNRKAIFMIDGSAGYMKDGPKNRLRDMDIHRIVDVFNKRLEIAKYSRMVGIEEIEKNEFNLNIPRYIDSQQAEDIQDIEGHLCGGIPASDIDALDRYWSVCPRLRNKLFSENRLGYVDLAVTKEAIKPTIYEHEEFVTFMQSMEGLFDDWRQRYARKLKGLSVGLQPKALIKKISEDLLTHYTGKLLIDKYDVYQHLMDYWTVTMQDDCYLIAADGWKATTYRVIEVKKDKDGKPGKEVDMGWTCDLVPKTLIVARYFAAAPKAITNLEVKLETLTAQLDEMEEEHSGDDGAFAELEKVTFATVRARLKELAKEGGDLNQDEFQVIKGYLDLCTEEIQLKRALRDAEEKLDALAYAKYLTLTEAEVKTLVVNDKWLAALNVAIHGEIERISQTLTRRVKELAERYETPLPKQVSRAKDLEQIVDAHLQRMGFTWA